MYSPISFPAPRNRSYCWVIVVAGVLGLFASLGLGRFSLGMMLPAMGKGLDLSYAQMGLISTINFCGYLGAVLFCGKLTTLWGARRLIFLALALVGGSMVMVGCTTSYVGIMLMYCLTGIGSALANVPVMALISTWFEPGRRGRAAGLCTMGNGFGLLFSGRAIPVLNAFADDWRLSWLVQGGVVLLIALLCLVLVRNAPTAMPVTPATMRSERNGGDGGCRILAIRRQILHCAAIYFLFGFAYVIYITFMVTSMVQERGLTERAAGELWSWVGLLSLVSGPIFGYFSDRFGRRSSLMLVFSIQTAAYLLVALKLPMASLYLSITCFAVVVWSVPSIMAALVGDYAGPQGAAAAFGFVTFTFGIGQIAGPAIAGMLAESTSSFSTSFFMAAAFALAAVVLSSMLPGNMQYRG